jgi:meso-butanediol dehydrogenase/(S,S)-butanediol dehydrogenase/diacetyl reductase
MRLQGKVVLITGAAGGIGRGIVEVLAPEGAKFCLADIETSQSGENQFKNKHLGQYTKAKAFAEELKARGIDAIAVECDVTKYDTVVKMVEQTVATFGRIDVFVNSAGVTTEACMADEITEEAWDNVMTTNAKGTFLTNKAVVKQLRNQGGGKIINIASIAGKTGSQMNAHYGASKAAVINWTNTLAVETSKEDITVNCICPGIIPTQMWVLLGRQLAGPDGDINEPRQMAVDATSPMGVDIRVEDIGEAVLFLAISDRVTRQAISVDGGATY